MLKRLLVPIIVMAFAGTASAQNDDSDKQPSKKGTPPAKSPAPKKDTKSQPKKKAALNVGDKTPALKVERWVKGAPVKAFEKGHVYVVEFWATWCPPCEQSIPHLTELQQKHKGLTIIGVAASEQKQSTGADRRLPELERWVKAKGDQMRYTVGYEGDRQMYREWMTAAGQTGIPCAFIVDGEGTIAYIGFPSGSNFEGMIEKTLKSAADKKNPDSKQKKDKSKQDNKPVKSTTPKTPAKPIDKTPPAKDDKK